MKPVASAACVLVCLVGCGGPATSDSHGPDGLDGGVPSTGAGPDAGSETGPDASPGLGCSGLASDGLHATPSQHLAQPIVCLSNDANVAADLSRTFFGAVPPTGPDAGAACTTGTDCETPDASYTPFSICLRGRCSADQCLADTDCPPGQGCLCGAAYHAGNAPYYTNVCTPSGCRQDSDCRPGGYCSPNPGSCGTTPGYFCHGPSDQCVESTDCACPSGVPASCAYSPQVGAFVCAQVVCAG